MNAQPGRWRRLAVKLAQHAACVMPGARSPWAEAMRRELDYIGDDSAALRWAFGCIVASYRARLTHRPGLRSAPALRYVATSGALMLVIGLALQANAGGPVQRPRPAFDETACRLPNASAACACRHDRAEATTSEPIPHHETAGREPLCCEIKITDPMARASDTSCPDRVAPVQFHPNSREADDRVH
jgi:hypothetical protein